MKKTINILFIKVSIKKLNYYYINNNNNNNNNIIIKCSPQKK